MIKKSKIKVLQVIHSMHIGGAEEIVAHLANNLDKELFETKVCCVTDSGILADKLQENGVHVFLPIKYNKNRYLNSYVGLKKIFKEFEPDIVNSHGDPALINLGPVYLFNKCPLLIHTYHFGNYPHIKKRYLYAQMVFARFASKLLAVSESQRQAIIKYHKVPPALIGILRNGVTENPYLNDDASRENIRKEFGVLDDEIFLGCVAVLSRQKGVIYLLEAANKILKNNDKIKIVIVGGGPLLQDLENQAKKLNIGDRLMFTGWRDDALKILPALDIFIQPSLWEAFSVVLLEAMAAKIPIIATDVADNSLVIEHEKNGLIIPPCNPDAIVSAVLRYASDMKFACTMAQNSYDRYLKNYTVARMVKNYENIYLEMLSE